MEQILVTINDPQALPSIRQAIAMLRGVVSTSVLKDFGGSKTQQQQAYVKDTLTSAMQEVKLSRLEGRKMQSLDDFISEMKQAQ